MSAHTQAKVWDRVEGVLLESARRSLSGMWPADRGECAVAIYGTLALRLGLVGSFAQWRRSFASYQSRLQERAP